MRQRRPSGRHRPLLSREKPWRQAAKLLCKLGGSFLIMVSDNAKFDGPAANNAEELSRLIEIELIQKRAEWQKAGARRKTIRSVSILFLFVVIMGALLAFYFAFSRVNEERGHQKPPATGAP